MTKSEVENIETKYINAYDWGISFTRQDIGKYKVKAFLWDENMEPLADMDEEDLIRSY